MIESATSLLRLPSPGAALVDALMNLEKTPDLVRNADPSFDSHGFIRQALAAHLLHKHVLDVAFLQAPDVAVADPDVLASWQVRWSFWEQRRRIELLEPVCVLQSPAHPLPPQSPLFSPSQCRRRSRRPRG